MLHAVGLGAIWSDPNLNLVLVSVILVHDVRQVWQADDGEPPVQEAIRGHWDESCFLDELMTSRPRRQQFSLGPLQMKDSFLTWIPDLTYSFFVELSLSPLIFIQ